MGKYSSNMSDERKPVGILPEGIRAVKVVSMEAKIAKSGNNMFVAVVEDMQTRDSQQVYLVNEPKKRWMLKSLLDAVGAPKDASGQYDWSESDVLGVPVSCVVVHYTEPWINREGKEVMLNKANVKEFMPLENTVVSESDDPKEEGIGFGE